MPVQGNDYVIRFALPSSACVVCTPETAHMETDFDNKILIKSNQDSILLTSRNVQAVEGGGDGIGGQGPDLILFGLHSLLRPLQPLFQLRHRSIMPLTRDCSCSLQRVHLPINPQLSTLSLLEALTQLRLVSVDLLDLFPVTHKVGGVSLRITW